jgi:hypothetical protein
VLPGFHTAAESSLRRGQPSGNELFLSLCGLMSSGTRTVLLSRWRAGGQTSIDLVREFAQELPHTSPAEAWQRSVQVAINTPVEPENEPRVKKGMTAVEALKSDHPFFWAGYMLADPGTVPPGEDKLLAIPGLDADKKAQPANPPPVPGRPAVGLAPPDEPAPEPPLKAGKGAKAAPRANTKKIPRQKSTPRDPSE